MAMTPARDDGKQITQWQHRPEIDGLRALAVLPVVFFHAGFSGFSGGYVGVDVFFVISGFLITSIILRQQSTGSFSLAHFFERRVRRILPPLFAMIILVLPFALLWMMPAQLKNFAGSLAAVAVFASNIFFWRTNGYFDVASEEKVLLHTWSLAVEEQFYLVFPLFALLVWRFSPRRLPAIIFLCLLISLGLAEWCAQNGRQTANFFLAPTRAWELLAGALCAFVPVQNSWLFTARASGRNALALLGPALILAACFFYDSSTSFPGVYALVPVLGAVLVILCAAPDTLAGRVLSSKVLAGTGMVSYSFYLWHQPLFSLARIRDAASPGPSTFGLLAVASFLLACLSWRFVEQPFRKSAFVSRRSLYLGCFVTAMAFGVLGVTLYNNSGYLHVLSNTQKNLVKLSEDGKHNFRKDCFLDLDNKPLSLAPCLDKGAGASGHVVLWGDSHAAHLYTGLVAASDRYAHLTHFSASACPPIPEYQIASRPYCKDFNRLVLSRILETKPDMVILASAWWRHPWPRVEETIKTLRSMGVSRIVLIGPAPEWRASLPELLASYDRPFEDLPVMMQTGGLERQQALSKKMQELASGLGIAYASPLDILCDPQGCLTRLGSDPSQLVEYDKEHFTDAGSRYVVSRLPLW